MYLHGWIFAFSFFRNSQIIHAQKSIHTHTHVRDTCDPRSVFISAKDHEVVVRKRGHGGEVNLPLYSLVARNGYWRLWSLTMGEASYHDKIPCALEVRLIKQDISARMGPWPNPFQVLPCFQVHRISLLFSVALSSSDSLQWFQILERRLIYILQHLFSPHFFSSFFTLVYSVLFLSFYLSFCFCI